MKNADERIAFAVRFAEMKLNTLRPGDWLNLRDDLAAFLGRKKGSQGAFIEDLGGIVAYIVGPSSLEDYTERDFEKLQKQTKDLLEHATALTGAGTRTPVPIHGRYTLMSPALPSAGQNYLLFEGAVQDCFLVTMLFLLAREPGDRIRRCPECKTLFLRIRKQEYCSRTCVSRVNKRAWREAHKVTTKSGRLRGRKRTASPA